MTDDWVFPKLDEQQDWMLKSAEEKGGSTTLEYERKRNTGDKAGDNEIKVCLVFCSDIQ